MTNPEIARLEAELESIVVDDTRAYQARRRAEGLEPMPAGWRLRSSERSKLLRVRIAELEREAAFDAAEAELPPVVSISPGPSLGPVEPQAATPPLAPPAFPISREDSIRHLAASSPEPLPAGMVEAALGSGQSFADFSLAFADHLEAARALREAVEGKFRTVRAIVAAAELASGRIEFECAAEPGTVAVRAYSDPREARAQEILAAAALVEAGHGANALTQGDPA